MLCYWDWRMRTWSAWLIQIPCVVGLLPSRMGACEPVCRGELKGSLSDYHGFAYWIACDKEITTLI